MKYQNTKTGFVFESDSECKGADWVMLNPPSDVEEEKTEPVKARRTRNNGNSK